MFNFLYGCGYNTVKIWYSFIMDPTQNIVGSIVDNIIENGISNIGSGDIVAQKKSMSMFTVCLILVVVIILAMIIYCVFNTFSGYESSRHAGKVIKITTANDNSDDIISEDSSEYIDTTNRINTDANKEYTNSKKTSCNVASSTTSRNKEDKKSNDSKEDKKSKDSKECKQSKDSKEDKKSTDSKEDKKSKDSKEDKKSKDNTDSKKSKDSEKSK